MGLSIPNGKCHFFTHTSEAKFFAIQLFALARSSPKRPEKVTRPHRRWPFFQGRHILESQVYFSRGRQKKWGKYCTSFGGYQIFLPFDRPKPEISSSSHIQSVRIWYQFVFPPTAFFVAFLGRFFRLAFSCVYIITYKEDRIYRKKTPKPFFTFLFSSSSYVA